MNSFSKKISVLSVAVTLLVSATSFADCTAQEVIDETVGKTAFKRLITRAEGPNPVLSNKSLVNSGNGLAYLTFRANKNDYAINLSVDQQCNVTLDGKLVPLVADGPHTNDGY